MVSFINQARLGHLELGPLHALAAEIPLLHTAQDAVELPACQECICMGASSICLLNGYSTRVRVRYSTVHPAH